MIKKFKNINKGKNKLIQTLNMEIALNPLLIFKLKTGSSVSKATKTRFWQTQTKKINKLKEMPAYGSLILKRIT